MTQCFRRIAAAALFACASATAHAAPVAQFDVDVANLYQLDTGFTGLAGQTYVVTATGLIDAAVGSGGYVVDADGVLQQDAGADVAWYFMNYVSPYTAPLAGQTRDFLPGLPFGSLIGRWDTSDSWDLFFIGAQGNITVPVDGAHLTLFVTDGSPWDNQGTYSVTINTQDGEVPEPGSLPLAALALLAAGRSVWRRKACNNA